MNPQSAPKLRRRAGRIAPVWNAPLSVSWAATNLGQLVRTPASRGMGPALRPGGQALRLSLLMNSLPVYSARTERSRTAAKHCLPSTTAMHWSPERSAPCGVKVQLAGRAGHSPTLPGAVKHRVYPGCYVAGLSDCSPE